MNGGSWVLTHIFLFQIFFFFSFTFISLRLITLQYCSGFLPYIDMNQLWIYMCSPSWTSIPSLLGFAVYEPWALVSCIQPGLAICFTLDNIYISMLFSQIIPHLPSPIESKTLFYIYLCRFFCLAYRVIITIFLNSIYMY